MTCLAEQLMNEVDPAALGLLFAALAATVADPRTDAGRLALEDDFVFGLSALADGLGVTVDGGRFFERNPETATHSAGAPIGHAFARAEAAEVEYVRLFVCDRYGPQCPPWASYYTEARLAGSSALRARDDETTIGGGQEWSNGRNVGVSCGVQNEDCARLRIVGNYLGHDRGRGLRSDEGPLPKAVRIDCLEDGPAPPNTGAP